MISTKADSLFASGLYALSLHEWERLGWYQQELSLDNQWKQAWCYYHTRNYTAAAERFSQWNMNATSPSDSGYWMTAVSYYLADEYALSLFHLEQGLAIVRKTVQKNDFILLKAIVLHEQGHFAEAKDWLQTQWANSPSQTHWLDSIYTKAIRFQPKSKFRAVLYSMLLPGLGQAYTGKPLDGLFSMALIGGVTYLTVWSFIQHRYYLATLTGIIFFQKLYEGGARYSEKLAIQYNQQKMNELKRNLHKALFAKFGSKNWK